MKSTKTIQETKDFEYENVTNCNTESYHSLNHGREEGTVDPKTKKQQESASIADMPAKHLHIFIVQNEHQTYLQNHSEDREKPTTSLNLHTVAQQRPHIL